MRWVAVLALTWVGGSPWSVASVEAAPAVAAADSAGATAPGFDTALPLRLVIVEPSAPLLARIEGQLSDLDVEVRVASNLDQSLDIGAAAQRLARERGAVWLVWTDAPRDEPGAQGRTICIWSSSAPEVYCRRFSRDTPSTEPGASSADFEVAALSVRSAVRATLIERSAALAEQRKSAAVIAQPPVAARERSAVAGPALREPASEFPRLWAGLGANWQLDGLTSRGSAALGLGLELEWEQWRAALTGSISQLAEVNLEQLAVRSRRGTVALELGRLVFRSGALALDTGLAAGLLWTTRESAAQGTGTADVAGTPEVGVAGAGDAGAGVAGAGVAEATGARVQLGPFAGARARVEYALSSRFALNLGAGVDWVPMGSDWLVLDDSDRPVAVRRTWHLQPGVGIAFRVALW